MYKNYTERYAKRKKKYKDKFVSGRMCVLCRENLKIAGNICKKENNNCINQNLNLQVSNQNLLINIFEKFVFINETYIHKSINLDHNSINNYSWVAIKNF